MNKYDALEKISKLRDEGILSEEEYIKEKKLILSGDEKNFVSDNSNPHITNEDVNVKKVKTKDNKRLVIITAIISIFVIVVFHWYSIYIFLLIGLIYLVQINQRFRLIISLSLIGLSIFGVILLFVLNQEFNNAPEIYNMSPKNIFTPSLSEKIDIIRNSMMITGIITALSFISGIYLLVTRKFKNKNL